MTGCEHGLVITLLYIYIHTHINSTNINVDFSIVTWVEKIDKIDITYDYWQQQSPPSILAHNTIQSRLNSVGTWQSSVSSAVLDRVPF